MIRYAIVISARARKEIDKLQPSFRERLAHALEYLAINPYAGKALKLDLKGLYSYRISDYRVIYEVVRHGFIIHIIKVMHSRDVYR